MAIYSDLNQYDPTSKQLVTDVKAIDQSITNILATQKMTRFFNPEFGADLDSILFELNDLVTAAKMENWIVNAIERWDPRVTLEDSDVTQVPDEYKMDVKLIYGIPGLSGANQTYKASITN